MFKNWNPFRKKSEKDGSSVKLQSFKQEPRTFNKENSVNLNQFSSQTQFSSIKSENKPSPRPITLARRGSLKITRLRPVAENPNQHDNLLNKSSFNSSFKSDRSIHDVSIFNASGPLLSSPFIPQVKQALGLNDTMSPFGSPNTSRSRVKRSNTFHYAPSHPTTTTPGSLPVVRLGRKDRHSFRDQGINSPNTVKIAPPDVQRFPTCRLTSIRERNSSTSSQAPDTQAVVTALRERRKRSYVQNEDAIMEDIESTQQSKRRRQESTQSTASSSSLPAMPDHLPDLSESGYTLMPIESVGVKRPAAPSRESFDEGDVEGSVAKRPKKENRNDPIKSSLRSSRLATNIEVNNRRTIPKRRHSINVSTRSDFSRAEKSLKISPAPSDTSMISLRNQATVILPSEQLDVPETLRKSNDDLFNGSENTSINNSQNDTANTSLSSAQSKRLLFDGVKQSTKKRQLSLYPSLNTSFKKVPLANVIASAEDYEKDREEEQKRVTDMLKEITEEQENKDKKEEKPVISETEVASSTTTIPSSTGVITTSSALSFQSAGQPKPAIQTSKPTSMSTPFNLGTPIATEIKAPTSTPAPNPTTTVSSVIASSVAATTASSNSSTISSGLSTNFKPVFSVPLTTSSTNNSVSTLSQGSSLGGTGISKPGPSLESVPTASVFGASLASGPKLNTSTVGAPVSQNVSFNLGGATTTSNSLVSTKPAADANPAKGGFTFGQMATTQPTSMSSGFGLVPQAALNPASTTNSNNTSTPSSFTFGLTDGSNVKAPPIQPQVTQPSFQLGVTQPVQPVAGQQTGLSFGQGTTVSSAGGFGFGGATAFSALSSLAGISAAETPKTDPPAYSQHQNLTIGNSSGGLPKPTFNFSATPSTSAGGFGFGGATALSALSSLAGISATEPPKTDPPAYSLSQNQTITSTSGGLPKPTFNFSAAPTTSNTGGSIFGTSASSSSGTKATSNTVFGPSQGIQGSAVNSFQFGMATASNPAPTAFGQTSAATSLNFGQSNPKTTSATQNAPSFSFGVASGASGPSSAAFGSTTAPAKPFAFGTSQSGPVGGFSTTTPQPSFGVAQPNTGQSTFGSKSATQSNVFGTSSGAPSGTPFGTQASNSTASVFGTASFGNQTQSATQSGSGFGQSGSVFGTQSQNPPAFGQSSSTNSGFQFGQASNTPSTGAFQFQTTPAKPSNPTPTFGQSSTNQNAGFNFAAPGSTPSFNFGSPTTQGPAPSGSFGTPSTPSNNPFTPSSIAKSRVVARASSRRRPRR
ncbi:hypothetical protein SNE40_014979 [Patella caerulea]|uniref:Uncharacterized protein n=1 Tax=Patella caerulea TaxID=87958 RepID=A0AAN8JMA0_PATCE